MPTDAPGFEVPFIWWTFNMPTDHAEVELDDVRVPDAAILGDEGEGLAMAQTFVHENRIRQAASGVGAAQYCINESVKYAKERVTFGKPLAERPGDPVAAGRAAHRGGDAPQLVRATACEMDSSPPHRVRPDLPTRCPCATTAPTGSSARPPTGPCRCTAGSGYTRHLPFEHIYRHHRRYRITEGSEEIQIRRVAGQLFGFLR